jgi:hypothetical protein
MDAVLSSEKSVDAYQTIRLHIQEDNSLYSQPHEGEFIPGLK